MSVAALIEAKRIENGWSKHELARRLKVSNTAVVGWTNHGRIPHRHSRELMEQWWGLAEGSLNGKSVAGQKTDDAHELHPNQATGVNQSAISN
jgi:ribosome-binding protein aMBF1 (putative translation factor)